MGIFVIRKKKNQTEFNSYIFLRQQSPIKQDPIVTVANGIQLQLNINTDQIGRTFQDRTHIFKILPRPSKNFVSFF